MNIERVVAQSERRWPHLQFKIKNANEASSACPFCNQATEDGFLVFQEGNFWCRQCDITGWVNEDDTLSDHERRILAIEAEQKRQKRQLQEQEKRIQKIELLQKTRPDLQYHRNLTDEVFEYWFSQGIYEEAVEQFRLGYCHSCPTCPQSASYTIPIYDYDSKLINVRHRLKTPMGGKYRPEMAGLPTSLYNAPVLQEPRDRIIIAEGEKKSITLTQHNFPAVGLMGKSYKWRTEWFDWFTNQGEVIIALDPDAMDKANKLGELFFTKGFRNIKIATFPTKVDDGISMYGAGLYDIEAVLKYARKVG